MNKFKLIISFFLLCSFIFLSPISAQKDATGADPIFEYLGLETPNNWESLNREERFALLENLGLYPERGGKYQGQLPNDLSLYFEKQGLTEPENWAKMTFVEKQAYLNQAAKGDAGISVQKPDPQTTKKENLVVNLVGINIFTLNQTSWKEIFLFFGVWAERLVIIIMFIKPAVVIFKTNWLKKIFSWRQTLGWLSTLLFVVHGLGFIWLYQLVGLQAWNRAHLIWAGVAGLLMLILGITSNKYSMKLLKTNWKKLQRLAYPTLFFILAHTSLVKQGDLRKVFVIGGAYLMAKVIELVWVKRKKTMAERELWQER